MHCLVQLGKWELLTLCSLLCGCPCRHFSEFLRSHHFCKYQIEVLTSGTVYLADILFCESALFYFSEVRGSLFLLFLVQFLILPRAGCGWYKQHNYQEASCKRIQLHWFVSPAAEEWWLGSPCKLGIRAKMSYYAYCVIEANVLDFSGVSSGLGGGRQGGQGHSRRSFNFLLPLWFQSGSCLPGIRLLFAPSGTNWELLSWSH